MDFHFDLFALTTLLEGEWLSSSEIRVRVRVIHGILAKTSWIALNH